MLYAVVDFVLSVWLRQMYPVSFCIRHKEEQG